MSLKRTMLAAAAWLVALAWLAMPLRAAAQETALVCSANTFYLLQAFTNNVHRMTLSGGSISPTLAAVLPAAPGTSAWNGMAVEARGGSKVYAVSTTGSNPGVVLTYDMATGSAVYSAPPSPADLGTASGVFLSGGVNPLNGWFYMASPMVNAGANTDWALFLYKPEGGAAPPVRIGTVTGAIGNNGDLTFDAQGNLYLVSGNIAGAATYPRVYRVRAADIPSSAGTANLPAQAVTSQFSSTAVGANYGGLAFADGEIMVSNSVGEYHRFDPSTGLLIASTTSLVSADLASCTYPNTIHLHKDLPSGRAAAGDQFALAITGGGLSTGNTATTAGSATGLQAQMAGPVLVLAGTTFTLTETAAGGANLGNYASTLQCVNETTGAPVAVSSNAAGTTGSFVMPGGGADVACTFRNTPKATIRLNKVLPSGRVQAGDQFVLNLAGTGAPAAVATSGSGSTVTGSLLHATAVPGSVYTLSESPAGTTVPADYTATYGCTNARPGGQTPSGSSTSFSLTPVAGDDLSCTFSNARQPRADLVIGKTNGAAQVLAGGTTTYTVTVTNNGPDPVVNAVVRDNWSSLPGGGLDCSAGPLVCTASGAGTQCPAGPTPAVLAAGLAIPALPVGGSVALALTCRVTATGS